MRVCPTAGNVIFATSTPFDSRLLQARARGNIGLDSDDWVDASGSGLLPEFVGAVNVSVISHGDCGHFVFRSSGHQLFDFCGTVEH